jgi:hypothetical protein
MTIKDILVVETIKHLSRAITLNMQARVIN